jgi:hypothetical protein
MPKVTLLSSSDPNVNLSDEAYAAFKEPPASVKASALTGGVFLSSRDRPAIRRSRVKEPTKRGATVKETLEVDQVSEMLAESVNWKLAIPNGDSTDVLTRNALKQASESSQAGTVTKALRGATLDELATIEDAKERLGPKAGAARYTTALGAPVTNVALLAAAAGGFFAIKGDEEVLRPALLLIAVIAAVLAIALSIAGNIQLGRQTVHLARLDLLQARPQPRLWFPNLCVFLFLVALVCAPFSVFPANASPAPAVPSFSPAKTTESGKHTKVEFDVTWKHLGESVKSVRTVVTAANGEPRTTTAPKTSDTLSTHLAGLVSGPTTLTAATELLGEEEKRIGDLITHTYTVPLTTGTPTTKP